jgi:hypothetical protein
MSTELRTILFSHALLQKLPTRSKVKSVYPRAPETLYFFPPFRGSVGGCLLGSSSACDDLVRDILGGFQSRARRCC